jgi:O-antigen/teichoic acid export membrane protein
MRQLVETDAAVVDELLAPVAPLTIDETTSVGGVAGGKPQKTLKQLATHGSIWTIGGYGCTQVLRFGANLVMARLLFPEAFGLMAIVNGVMQGLVMFSDVGIGQSIIRHARNDDPEFFNTAWTVQVIRGFMLMFGAMALAWPAGYLYDPFLIPLISAVAVTALISGFAPTKLMTANRDLKLARLTIIDLTAQIVAIIVMVLFAWSHHSVWAFVIGSYASVSVRVALAYLVIPGPTNRFHWSPVAAHELLKFGRWIFVSTMFTFLAMQSDKLILGQMVPLVTLGVYSVAFSMMATVSGVFEQLSGRVLMPAMCHVSKSSSARFADLVLRSRRIILMCAVVCVADLILLAPSVFRLLYDNRYQDAAWMTQLLGCGLWFTLLQRTSEASLLAMGHSRVMAAANATNFLVTIIAAPLGFYWKGIEGFICGWTLGNFAAVVVMDLSLTRFGIAAARQDLTKSAYLAALCAAGFTLQHFSHQHVTGRSLLLAADISVAAAISIVGAVIIFVRNRHFAFVKAAAV